MLRDPDIKTIYYQNCKAIKEEVMADPTAEAIVRVLSLSYHFRTQEGEERLGLKDGLVFLHAESVYENKDHHCLNTLALHWRDPSVSTYCSPVSEEGLSDAVLRLSEDGLETLEGMNLQIRDQALIAQLQTVPIDRLYNITLRLEVVDSTDNLVIARGFLTKGKPNASRVNPDHLSKIVSKQNQALSRHLSLADLIRAVEANSSSPGDCLMSLTD